ncbi:FMN adenylyltransferase [Candidatus Parcubacteria bacterium]|nr:MAG: FMN adenylyltransferase [Candidatus Parcubacteria bacterium]
MQTFKEVEGVVQRGTKRAAALGFPTINIPFKPSEARGVYAARVSVGNAKHIAAAFADPERGVLEAHLLDFPMQELYGKKVVIELYEKIRDSARFDNDEKLRMAIAEDVSRVRDYFKQRTQP